MEKMFLPEWVEEAKIISKWDDVQYHVKNKDSHSYQKFTDDC